VIGAATPWRVTRTRRDARARRRATADARAAFDGV
jgi:hypothetical protein